jgi:hypothetical protein
MTIVRWDPRKEGVEELSLATAMMVEEGDPTK